MANKRTVTRSAITGRFVTKDYALRHPKTTTTEKIAVKSDVKPVKGTRGGGPKNK